MPFVEWDPFLRVWRQGSNFKPNFKPKRYFTRPHDGKRPGWGGRVKDAFSGEGADVFVTTSGDKRTLMRDRPQRWQWSGWKPTLNEQIEMRRDKDFRWQDFQPVIDTKFGRKRWEEPFYNYRNREFESFGEVWRHPEKVWTNVQWPQGAKHSNRQPWNYRDLNNDWWGRVPFEAGFWPGGRPRR